MSLVHLRPGDVGNRPPRRPWEALPSLLLLLLWWWNTQGCGASVLGTAVPGGLGSGGREAPPSLRGKNWERLEYPVRLSICALSSQEDCGFKEGREMMIMKIRGDKKSQEFCLLPGTWGAQHVLFVQLGLLSLIFQCSALHLWMCPPDCRLSPLSTLSCKARVPLLWFGSYRESAGGRELHTAENFKTSWTKEHQQRSHWVWVQSKPLRVRVCREPRLFTFLWKSAGGKDGWGSGSKVSREVPFKRPKNSKNVL